MSDSPKTTNLEIASKKLREVPEICAKAKISIAEIRSDLSEATNSKISKYYRLALSL